MLFIYLKKIELHHVFIVTQLKKYFITDFDVNIPRQVKGLPKGI